MSWQLLERYLSDVARLSTEPVADGATDGAPDRRAAG
jgi:hypothetical protein